MNLALIVFVVAFVAVFLLRVPIGFGMVMASVFYFVVSPSPAATVDMVASKFISEMSGSFIMIAVPLYIFMAEIMNTGKVTRIIFDFAAGIVGKRRGALAQVNIVNSIIFSGMTGSAIADASGPGNIEMTAMIEEGYPRGFTAAVTAASATEATPIAAFRFDETGNVSQSSVPELLNETLPRYAGSARTLIGSAMAASVRQVYVVGCGDSFMAAAGSELAFWTLAGLPCRAATALHFARYVAPHLHDDGGTLVIGVSVSGQVARTVEALRMASRAGARTVALTGNESSRLALSGQCVFPAVVPPMTSTTPSPGARSYIASLLALDLLAIRLGEARGFLEPSKGSGARDELRSLPELQAEAIRTAGIRARDWLQATNEIREFVFLGAGPSYGVALFGAAKMLEASGDSACGQDLEEWAHLQYFARDVTTPTVIIDCAGAGYSRAREVAQAAKAIGRTNPPSPPIMPTRPPTAPTWFG